ncbi:hypothetical protein DYBT9275_05295 [Dyadobacter sp. CECT 9275]|uniref:Uncharacterized protein n=1 Tax=Dyadobacter helix TaxID=2822344 RepID=A0A916JH61_9BACT|nr:hypothetical protein DYBT9275_05295 [Dyadobacter sp. CECT 9275]
MSKPSYKKITSTRGRHTTYKTYEIETENGLLTVTRAAFYKINEGDRITLMRSIFTNAVQKVRLSQGGDIYTFSIGFLRARAGTIVVPILIICIIVNLSANKRLARSGKRQHLPFVWLTGLLVIMGFYFGLDSLFI